MLYTCTGLWLERSLGMGSYKMPRSSIHHTCFMIYPRNVVCESCVTPALSDTTLGTLCVRVVSLLLYLIALRTGSYDPTLLVSGWQQSCTTNQSTTECYNQARELTVTCCHPHGETCCSF